MMVFPGGCGERIGGEALPVALERLHIATDEVITPDAWYEAYRTLVSVDTKVSFAGCDQRRML
jgi:hypothetical protein